VGQPSLALQIRLTPIKKIKPGSNYSTRKSALTIYTDLDPAEAAHIRSHLATLDNPKGATPT